MWLPSIRGIFRRIQGLVILLLLGAWGFTPNALAELRMEFPDGTEVRPGRDWKLRVVWEDSRATWKTLRFTVEAPAALGDVEARRPDGLGSGIQLTQTQSPHGALVEVALNGLTVPSGQCLAELHWHLAPELAELVQASVALESISVVASYGNPTALLSSRQPLKVASPADGPAILQARLPDLQLFGEPGTLHLLEGSSDAVVWDPFQGETLHSALGWDSPVGFHSPQSEWVASGSSGPGRNPPFGFRSPSQPSRIPGLCVPVSRFRSASG